MRILYAVHGYKPAYRIGGPIMSASAAGENLVRRGHQVTVFTSNSNLTDPLDVPTDRAADVNGVEVWYLAGALEGLLGDPHQLRCMGQMARSGDARLYLGSHRGPVVGCIPHGTERVLKASSGTA